MEPERKKELIARIKRELEPLTEIQCEELQCEECPAQDPKGGGCTFILVYDKVVLALK